MLSPSSRRAKGAGDRRLHVESAELLSSIRLHARAEYLLVQTVSQPLG